MNVLRHGLTGQIEVTAPEEKEAKDKFFAGIIFSLAPAEGVERQFAQSIAEDPPASTVRPSASEPYPRNVLATGSTSGRENNIFTLACSFEAAKAERIRSAVDFDPPQDERVRCAADFNEEDADDEAANPEVDKALGAARAFIADPKRFQLLTIYEGRIHRNMTKNLQQLTELQATRHAAEAKQNALREQALEEARLHTQLAEMEGVPCENGFVYSTAEIPNHPHRQPPESGQTRRILQLEPIRPPRRLSV